MRRFIDQYLSNNFFSHQTLSSDGVCPYVIILNFLTAVSKAKNQL